MQSSYVGWWTHLRYLELVVVVDHFRYLYSESNVSLVQREVLDVVNILGIFYQPFKVDVILTGIEVWDKGNQIPTDDIVQMLEDSASWKLLQLDA